MLEQDPEFVSPSLGAGINFNGLTADWSLSTNSPCINNGSVDYGYNFEFLPTDIIGEERILMDTIDIGAYEFRNFMPVRTGSIADQQFVVAIFADKNIPLQSVFTDNNTGDILSYSISGDTISQFINTSINAGNINIIGTPIEVDTGISEIVITATDLFGEEATDTFAVEVLSNQPPMLTNALEDIEVYVLGNLNYSIPANSFADPDENDTLVYDAKGEDSNDLPDWLFFDARTNIFFGIPQTGDIGELSIVVTATDLASNSVSDTFKIIVLNAVSIGSITGHQFRIYPLPADDIIFIEAINIGEYKLKVKLIDITGKVLDINTSINNDQMQINISNLPAGIYYLKIINDKEYKVYKISII